MLGRFDFAAKKEFQEAIVEIGQGGECQIIINLQDVSFMDSAGLGMLAIMHRKLTAQHIHVTLVKPRNYVKQILELAKMDRYFSIYATEEQAMFLMVKA